MRGLTRFKWLAGVGKNETFVKLEPKVLENFNNFDIRSLSHVMYAYGFREQGNPELHKKFIERFRAHNELMDYHTMNNLIYYLMFRDNVDEDLWTKVIEHTLQRNDHIPVTHYTPFKMSRYYIQHHFPSWDIRDYYDKFFFPERYYNASLKEKLYLSDESKVEFTKYLANHFFLIANDYVTFHNCFLLRHVFMDQKIAINFFANHELMPQEHRISARQKLDGKIMGYEGWEVLNITQKEHDAMFVYEKNDFYKGWITTAKERQIEKGIIPREPPQYV